MTSRPIKTFRILIIILLLVSLGLTVTYLITNPESKTLDDQARLGTSGEYISLSQGITHYEMTGPDSAETVVLVHGFSVPAYIWDSTFYALVKVGFRVVRYDTYGRGYSDRLDVDYDEGVYDRQLMDLVEVLHLKPPFHLVGLSFGGPVTSYFTAHHPELIKTLSLVDPAVRPFEKSAIPEFIARYFFTVTFTSSGRANQAGDFLHPETFPGWNDKYEVQMQYKGFLRSLVSTVFNYRADPAESFKTIAQNRTPVLLIWGKQDPIVPFADSTIPIGIMNPKFVAVEESGHLPQMEQPDVVMGALLEFLRK